jgi:CheY-like chemotaxis protein
MLLTEKSLEIVLRVAQRSVTRVFVVDDDMLIASSLAAILKLHGYSATSFTSPLEALAAVLVSAPDLLISDVAMPGLSGIDLAIQIKPHVQRARFFSSQDMPPPRIYLRVLLVRASPSHCSKSLFTRP